jgi:stage III sporulation protein SpoIIIAA
VLVPEHIGEKLVSHPEIQGLVEIVLDLGRRPLARFPSGDWFISETKVTDQDLQHAISMVSINLFVFFYLISGGHTCSKSPFGNGVW